MPNLDLMTTFHIFLLMFGIAFIVGGVVSAVYAVILLFKMRPAREVFWTFGLSFWMIAMAYCAVTLDKMIQ